MTKAEARKFLTVEVPEAPAHDRLATLFAAKVRQAVMAEREACAQIAEAEERGVMNLEASLSASAIADRIRARP